ncbi:B3 domain-containing transcription factor VRN1-like [Rhodamnia argentea]|uniref:B3 domain-containing transcription factor VRN1-like n=1 Tax=Rhodamnia argentea TaxID=178133 RepID=A0ABM3HGH7_9MYRT|nr:B3 domain-containing transcription factor VRN1-like [Rhodamnia argentea]
MVNVEVIDMPKATLVKEQILVVKSKSDIDLYLRFCTIESNSDGIPKRFVRKYGKNLPETVRLRVPDGGSWRVELEKWDDIVWLAKGWKEFAEHYSICEGHFLVFKYVGDSGFHVLIFDKSATEIDYPLIDTVEFVPPKTEDVDDHCNLSVRLRSLDGFSPKRKEKDELHLKSYHHKPSKAMKSDSVNLVDDATTSHAIVLGLGSETKGFRADRGATLLPQDSEGRMENSKGKVSPAMLASLSSASEPSRVTTALEAAGKYELQYPSFTVVIRAHHQLKNGVTVPGSFFKGRINRRTQTATLKYTDGSWPVKLVYYPQHGSGKLSAGWCAFQKGTSLKEGDACVFELVKIDNVELKVSILRRNVET